MTKKMKKTNESNIDRLYIDAKLESIDSIFPYENNPKEHPEEQINLLSSMMKRYGWVGNPIVIDFNRVIVMGHGRYLAAQRSGFEQVPVVKIEDMDEKMIRALRIADNKVAETAWSEPLLADELKALLDDDNDLDELYRLTGFDDFEFNDLLDRLGEEQLSQEQNNTIPIEEGKTDPEKEWEGMPEFNQQDKTAFKRIVVNFKSQEDVDTFAALINREITEKTHYIWFPNIEIEQYKDKRYETSE